MRISSTPASSGSSNASTAAYTAARIEALQQTRDRLALTDLQAGKLLPFIEYAKSTMDSRSGDELARWQKLLADTQDKQDEMTIAESVNAGDIQLEVAQKWLEDRRAKLPASDARYADLTKQIADVKNSIQARDFNAKLNTAQADLVASGNSLEGKQKYLSVIVDAYTRAKDPAAQKALATQIGQLRTEIQNDRLLQRAQADNSMMIRYLTPGSGIKGQDIMTYFAEQAAKAETPAEAARYETLATQVATRERTLQAAQLKAAASGSGGGGGGGGASLVTVAADIKAQTADAVATYKASVAKGRPDDKAFMLAKEATDRELNAIDAALPGATTSAAKTLLARRDAAQLALDTAQRSGALKLVAIEQDANTVFNDNLKQLRDSGATPEEIARTIASRVGQIALRKNSILFDGLQGDPQTEGELSKMETLVRGKLTTDEQAAGRVLAGDASKLTPKIAAEYARYASGFTQQGKKPPVGPDEWMRIMIGNATDEQAAAKLGVSSKGTDIQGFRTERSNAQLLHQERTAELKIATDQYVASVWPRNMSTGARTAYNAPVPTDGSAGAPGGRPAYFDPTRGGAFDPNTFGPLVAGHQRGGPQQADAGNGVVNVNDVPPTDPNAPADTGAGPLTGHAGPMSQAQNTDPHAAADAYLASFTDFNLPTWEIPNLPVWSPFGPSFDAGVLDAYAPPPLPTFTIPAEAVPSPSGGGVLTQGTITAPPSAVGAAPMTEAAGGPMLTQ